MDKREVREVLAAHADQLVGLRTGPPSGVERHSQVKGLLELAEQLQGILVPVEVDTHYRRRLHGELVLEAQSRESDPQASLFQQHRKGIIIGAAAVGSVVSVAGVVVAFLIRHRHGGAPRVAAG